MKTNQSNYLSQLYAPSLTLLADLYALTMAQAHWKASTGNREAIFELTFRQAPFGSGFSVACGLGTVIQYLSGFHFTEDDIHYLGGLTGEDEEPLFAGEFLAYLKALSLSCDMFAIPEGSVVFPHEPLIRVQGPILQCQLLESALLNIINYQTLTATHAARMKLAARGEPIIEFGLRRAQGIDGSVSASRAAYVGGCDATSNLLAGKLLGIPVRGTHAHSWVLAFDDELEAFRTYADAMPNNVVLLVDTYDTLTGVRKAAAVGKELRERGHNLLGIRLDSGDLAWLSIQARKILDDAGLVQTKILASNDLDEYVIESLNQQGAAISVWGVGTRLVTGGDCSALGGVYKLTALRNAEYGWDDKLKLSEQTVKISTPGIHQVRRYKIKNEYRCDAIYDVRLGIEAEAKIIDPSDSSRSRTVPVNGESFDLLVPILQSGKLVYDVPSLQEVQSHAKKELGMLPEGIKRFLNPHAYPAGLEKNLYARKVDLIKRHRENVL